MMKNRLNKLWNLPIKNPTQNRYLRFMKTPEGRLQSMFSRSTVAFNKKDMQGIKTAYSELLDMEI